MNKSEIAQLVSQVREVVKGRSNNDIVIALHSYDMDVERTIRAFVEDGASSVLEDWVRPTTSKKNKKKKASSSVSQEQNVATSTAPLVQEKAKTANNTPLPAQPKTAVQAPVVVSRNGTSSVAKENAPPVSAGTTCEHQITSVFNVLREAIKKREQVLLQQCSRDSKFAASDIDHLTALISSFGSVLSGNSSATAKPLSSPASGGIKHATSQSSLSSSVGADSGVHLSPTHQEIKPAPKDSKPVSLAAGGITMASDALSEDQLAALQRSLQEQLAARGIDASILSGVTQGDMPARRPRKPNDKTKAQKDKPAARPKLSILNNASV